MSKLDEFPTPDELGIRYVPQTSNRYANFSIRGNLGRSRKIEFEPSTADPPGRVILAEAQTEPGVAQRMGVTVFLVSSNINVDIIPLRMFVEFGNGGVQAEAEFTFEDGLTFSVPSSWTRVLALAEPSPVTTGDLRVAAFITTLNNTCELPAHFELQTGPINPAATSSAIPVEKFSRSLTVLSLGGEPFTVGFLFSAVLQLGTVEVAAGASLVGFPIPPRATSFTITNDGALLDRFETLQGIVL